MINTNVPQTDLIVIAQQWAVDTYAHNSRHLLNTLEWLDRLAPDSAAPVRMAALTHDMERAFPGPDQPIWNGDEDYEYYVAHSRRSARIVGDWLRDQGAASDFVAEVRGLIEVHEFGGWPAADLVQAADSLSFLDVNVDLFLNYARTGKYRVDQVAAKFEYSVRRIRIREARELARPLLDAANARLLAEFPGADFSGVTPASAISG
jgi:hypothetical protein